MIIDGNNNIGSNVYVLKDRWETIDTLPRSKNVTLPIQLMLDSGSIVEGTVENMLKNWIEDEYWQKRCVAWRLRERPAKRYEIVVGEADNCYILYLYDRINGERVALANYINDEADAKHMARLYSMQWKVDYYG